jgi:predicted nucleic acid-binding protein
MNRTVAHNALRRAACVCWGALAADPYRTVRRAGVTIRKTLDRLIAAPCVRTGAPLLHADADFDLLASCTPLRLYS